MCGGLPSQVDTTVGGLIGYCDIGRKPLPIAVLVVLSTRAGRT
jgi:hypothetical protein